MAIGEGPFAGGTTQLVSQLGIDLDRWYDLEQERVTQIFGTSYDTEKVGNTGEGLGGHSRSTADDTEDLAEKAEEHGRTGHSAKTTRARDHSSRAQIRRRPAGNVTDPEHGAGMNFTTIQRGIRLWRSRPSDTTCVSSWMGVHPTDCRHPTERVGEAHAGRPMDGVVPATGFRTISPGPTVRRSRPSGSHSATSWDPMSFPPRSHSRYREVTES